MLRMMLIAGAAMACVGCVSAYAPPPEGAQTASVAFQHDPATASATFQQVLSSVDGPGCEKVAFIGDYHPMTAALGLAGRHEVQVAAGRPVYLLAETYDNSESVVLAGRRSYRQCVNLVDFTPQPGHRYALRQTYANRICRVQIDDLEAGAPAPQVSAHEPAPACWR